MALANTRGEGMSRILDFICLCGFIGGLIASIVSLVEGKDIRAIYFLGLSAYIFWVTH
jgi:hypothetical protein